MNPDQPSDDRKAWARLSRYWEMGFVIPSSIVVGFVLGKLLDYWLHTQRIFIAGVILGAVAGFVQMIRLAIASSHEK